MSIQAARTTLRVGVRIPIPADASVPGRGHRGLHHAVLVGRHQGDDPRRLLWRIGCRRCADDSSRRPSPTPGWPRPPWRSFRGWATPTSRNAVRTGAVSYDRLRPLDFYSLWYARAAGWMTARVVPRTVLMLRSAQSCCPSFGLGAWAMAAARQARWPALLFVDVDGSGAAAVVRDGDADQHRRRRTLNHRGVERARSAASDRALRKPAATQPVSGLDAHRVAAAAVRRAAGYSAANLLRSAQRASGDHGPRHPGSSGSQSLVALGRWWMSRMLAKLEVQGG